MALTALKTATSPNVAYTRLLYTVSGSNQATNPQFQYVCDVYNRDTNELLKRMTQPINPAGTATFDVARIVQGELKPDYNWKINTPTEFSLSKQGFEVKFGQQYATSISSSVTVYPNLATYQLYCNQGVIEPNAGAYNFQQVVNSNTLSNMPATMSMQANDYGTISAYVTSGTTVISQSFYNANGVLLDTKNYSLTSGFDDYFWAIPISSSNANWNYVDVSLSGSYDLKTFRYEVSNETHREKVRFAFVNKLGAWDYYNNYNPVRQTMDVSREQYTAPRVDYSSRVSNYDIIRRGRTDYHNSTDDSFTTQTDYLDQTNANWLEELIESPSVYIQRNGEFIPIIITDSSYVANTNENRQKLFQYTINFKPANQPFGTWIPEYVTCPGLPPFDATLNGEISPYFWYDFSDRSTISATGGDYNNCYEIISKGTNTGSLARGSSTSPKYTGSKWEGFVSEDEYAIFNPNVATNGKNSTVARRWGTGNFQTDNVFLTGSQMTTLTITNYDNAVATNTSGDQDLISIKQEPNPSLEEINLFGFGLTGTFATSSNETLTFLSTDTTNFRSASYLEYESPNIFSTDRDHVIYSYNGASAPTSDTFETRYMVYNSGSNNGFKVGREPISQSSQTFVTSSVVFSSGTSGILTPEGLAIGSRALALTSTSPSPTGSYTAEPYSFRVAQVLVYDAILTDDQIQRVIDNYKQSVSYGNSVNSITN